MSLLLKKINILIFQSLEDIKVNDDAAYLHITSNNTIYGTQWKQFPETGNVPLVADMSSDILSEKFDVSKFGHYLCWSAKKSWTIWDHSCHYSQRPNPR